jgi:hypothetical protein
MHMRMLAGVALALALLLGMGACVDDPVSVLTPDDAVLARGNKDAAPMALRLMSRNIYLGANIDHVLFDPIDGPGLAWNELVYTNYPARAPVLAAEIASRQPHLVGVQEVATYYLLDPQTFQPVMAIEFLDILRAYLAGMGSPYHVAAVAVNFQTYLPMGGYIVAYIDSDVILAHPTVQVHASGFKHFDHQVNLSEYVPGLGPNLRSYQWADVTAEGQRFLFVNTHLEVQGWDTVQVKQTAELLGFVGQHDGPVFMVGDFNSAANRNAPDRAKTATYSMIMAAGFHDLWLPHDGVMNNSGPSCCQASDLTNEDSQLVERIDFLFARDVAYWKGNRAAAAKVRLFGNETWDRFLVTNSMAPELGEYYLWPSDHAGLFGEVLVGGT